MQILKAFLVISAVLFESICTHQIKWDGLRVKFGVFLEMPTTKETAINAGFVKLSSCDSDAAWRGDRYIRDNDYSVILLYDVNGYFAGIQTSIPKDLDSGYPSASLQPPFVSDGDFWVLTAYVTDPDKICNTGRSQEEFELQGTGSDLYIQNSTCPECSIQIPRKESDLAGSPWTEGKCAPLMGKHYWWNLYPGIACDSLAPWFLLYNNGTLTAFGFVFTTNLPSQMYERPPRPRYQNFMDPVPECLATDGVINSLHIYLTNNVKLNLC